MPGREHVWDVLTNLRCCHWPGLSLVLMPPRRELLPSLRTSVCGLWDGCPSLNSPPIGNRGYYFVSLSRLFSSSYYDAGHGPRGPVLLAI